MHPKLRPNSAPISRGPLFLIATLYPLISIVGQIQLGIVLNVSISAERLFFLILGPLGLIEILKRGDLLACGWSAIPASIRIGLIVWFGGFLLTTFVHFGDDDLFILSQYAQKGSMALLFAFALVAEGSARRSLRLFALATSGAALASLYLYGTTGVGDLIRVGSFVSTETGEMTIISGLARAGAVGGVPAMACWLEAIYAKTRVKRLLWFGLMLLVIVASLLALRREYLISISACLLVGLFILPLGRSKLLLAFAIGIIVAISVVIIRVIPEWMGRYDETILAIAEKQDARLLMLQAGPGIFLEKPLFGHGLGSYPMLMGEKLPVALRSEEEIAGFYSRGLASHNSFLTAAVEGGMFALAGIVLFMGALILWSIRICLRERREKLDPTALFAPLIMIQVFASCFFGDGLVTNSVWAYLGILFAIVALSNMRARLTPFSTQPFVPTSPGGHRRPIQTNVRIPRLG